MNSVQVYGLFEQCGRLLQGGFEDDATFDHAWQTFTRICNKIGEQGWCVRVSFRPDCVATHEQEHGVLKEIPIRRLIMELFLYDNDGPPDKSVPAYQMKALALIHSQPEHLKNDLLHLAPWNSPF